MRVFRWRALVPLALLLVVVAVAWYFLLDNAVRRGIEIIGTDLVGARVDLAEADVRWASGSVALRGLQVTNPDAPMTNLVQVDEIVADLRLAALLQKKIFVDTVAVRGLRFGTARETSGAIDDTDGQSGAVRRRIQEWADRVPIPEFSLQGLTGTVNVAAIRPESLQTPQVAQGIVGAADSARQAWLANLEALNPVPVVDSARALAQRLSGASLLGLGFQGVTRSVRSVQTTLTGITNLRGGIDRLQQDVGLGIADLQRRIRGLAAARSADLTNARNLLQIPSLNAPDISPALFGEVALARVQPLLYWAEMAERYVPPGLDPRRRPGPARARLAGSDVEFPSRQGYAGLTVVFAAVDMILEGDGPTAGRYSVQVNDFSSAPSVHGRPIRISAARTAAGEGPDAVHFTAQLDHVTPQLRDSVALRLSGVSLPAITLPGIGAHMDLGRGVNELSLTRVGDSLNGRWVWSSSNVTWDRGGLGSGRVNDILWRTLSGLRDVQVEVRVGGSVRGPRLAVRSNVAAEISRRLRRELRNEVAAAEQRVRAEVERLVAPPIADAQARVTDVETTVRNLVGQHQRQLDEVRTELEARLGALRRIIPAGR